MELIGSKTAWVATARMCGIEIEFPPEEHGDFEIILRVMSSDNMGTNTNNLANRLGAVQLWRAAGANVEPIEDQVVGAKRGLIAAPFVSEDTSNNGGVNTISTKIVDGGTSCIDSYLGYENDRQTSSTQSHVVAMMRVHVRVKPVTAGERNVIRMYMQAMAIAGDTSPAVRILAGTTLEIKEYNALDDLDLSKGFINKSGVKVEQVIGGKAKEDVEDDFITSNF